jgi:hypothetical protein
LKKNKTKKPSKKPFNYSNGFLEGLNNKTEVIKRNDFGFRRDDHFRGKILLIYRNEQFKVTLGGGWKILYFNDVELKKSPVRL